MHTCLHLAHRCFVYMVYLYIICYIHISFLTWHLVGHLLERGLFFHGCPAINLHQTNSFFDPWGQTSTGTNIFYQLNWHNHWQVTWAGFRCVFFLSPQKSWRLPGSMGWLRSKKSSPIKKHLTLEMVNEMGEILQVFFTHQKARIWFLGLGPNKCSVMVVWVTNQLVFMWDFCSISWMDGFLVANLAPKRWWPCSCVGS